MTVVRFSPVLFHGEDDEDQPRSVVAIGGQDATVSVDFCKSKTSRVFRDCFRGRGVDLAWSRNGSLLCASSLTAGTKCVLSSLTSKGSRKTPLVVGRAGPSRCGLCGGGRVERIDHYKPAEITQRRTHRRKKG